MILNKTFLYKRKFLVKLTGNMVNEDGIHLYEIQYQSMIPICCWTAWVQRHELAEVHNDS